MGVARVESHRDSGSGWPAYGGQLFAVPGLSGALAGLYPSQTSMRWPYLIMGVLFLFCIEAAFVAVWKLFSLSGSGANSSR